MDLITWSPLPIAQLFLRLLLSMIFFFSSLNKIRQPQQFITTIASYRLFPKTGEKALAFAIIGTELVVSLLLFIGWKTRIAAEICILMLIIFSCAIGINLIRRRTDLECGCFGSKHSIKINFKLISRNFILIIAAVYVMMWGAGSLALDSSTLAWERLSQSEMLLPLILVCVGVWLFFLLLRQLHGLLLLIPLEE